MNSRKFEPNPYLNKFAVITGSKGRSKFHAGTVKFVKDKWKYMGVHIVSPEKADFIIIPDGSKDRGKRGNLVPIISYSEFEELLIKTPKPTQTVPTPPAAPPLSTAEFRRPKFEFKVKPRTELLEVKYMKPKVKFERSPRVENMEAARIMWHIPSLNVQTVQMYAAKLKTISSSSNDKFYPTLYMTKLSTYQQITSILVYLLQFWEELRVNLELVFVDKLPTKLSINVDNPCELYEETATNIQSFISQPYLKNCWSVFSQKWSDEYLTVLSHPNILNAEQIDLADYFWKIESCLLIQLSSIHCKIKEHSDKFKTWILDTRSIYFRKLNGENVCESKKCKSTFCMLHEHGSDTCLEKPILFILEELVLAFCDASTIVPLSEIDFQSVRILSGRLQTLYNKWFGLTQFTNANDIQIIQYIYQTMVETLKKELGYDKDVMWSELPQFLSTEQFDDDWSPQQENGSAALKAALFSEKYQNLIRDIGAFIIEL